MIFYSHSMELNIKNGVSFLRFPSINKLGFVNHAFSTKLGGISSGEFSSMNLSFNRGDSYENVIENYKRLCLASDINFDTLVASAQDHNTFIRTVTDKEIGIGITKPRDLQSVDGLITNVPNVTLVIYFADCVPIILVDPVKKAIGAVHSGWRGTVKEIAKVAIDKMKIEYGCNPENFICTIGPNINKCCYEVDENVFKEFNKLTHLSPEKFIQHTNNNKYMIDLSETNKQILLNCGVQEKNISVSDLCTKCNSELLFSHRATNGRRGGMAGFVCIK